MGPVTPLRACQGTPVILIRPVYSYLYYYQDPQASLSLPICDPLITHVRENFCWEYSFCFSKTTLHFRIDSDELEFSRPKMYLFIWLPVLRTPTYYSPIE